MPRGATKGRHTFGLRLFIPIRFSVFLVKRVAHVAGVANCPAMAETMQAGYSRRVRTIPALYMAVARDILGAGCALLLALSAALRQGVFRIGVL